MTRAEDTGNASIPLAGTLAERHALFTRKVRASARLEASSGGEINNLDPLFISGLIESIKTPDVDGGVNHALLHANESGLLVSVFIYPNMREGDWIRVFWGDDSTPVASDGVRADHIAEGVVSMYVPASRVADGISTVKYTVTRAGSGNEEDSLPLSILVRTLFPGGTDPEPDKPGHQNLKPPVPDLPPGDIIDEEAAQNGIKVTIPGYLNMRVYDSIRLSWGGEILEHEVTQAEVDAGEAEILVTEATILAAGDSDELVLVYYILDEVHNRSSDWSERTYVVVEIGEGLLDAPLIQNPDPDTEFLDIIDLDKLGESDLDIDVMVLRNTGVAVGDQVQLQWVGTTSQGQPVTVEPDPQTVTRVPDVLSFQVPNADLLSLALGRGVASYVVRRDGADLGTSKRAFVTFLGTEQRLPKPVVSDVVNGVLDPTLASVTVTVAGEALGAGDTLYTTWLGTRSNGTPLHQEFKHNISGGNAGKPVVITIAGDKFIAPLNGGSVSVYYRIEKFGGGELDSDRERLMVGEAQFELPAPFTRPPSDSGSLDPEDIAGQLEVVILPYPGMKAGQTVHLDWRSSDGSSYSDYMPLSPAMEGQEVVFYMDRAKVEEFLGQDIEVSYRVETPGEPEQVSGPALFTVGAKVSPLPKPVVVEAIGDVLNPGDAVRGATVRIPVDANLVFGDEVEVYWEGDKPGGNDTVDRPVRQEDVGQPFDLLVDYEFVVANADGNVVVSYKVFRQAGPAQTSDAISLRVQSAELPLPEIIEAENGELNPDDVLEGATVRIHASAQFKEGDVVSVVVSSSVAGGSTTIEYTVPPGGDGQQVIVTVPYAVINASTGTTIDLAYEVQRKAGGPTELSDTVHYLINRQVGAGPLRVMGARFNNSTYRASSAPRMLSALHDTTLAPLLAEWRYDGDSQWTPRTHWFDNKPWLKLYVRSEDQTWMLQPANIIGNGIDTTANGSAAFVAMRDEVTVGGEIEVDMVAWGNAGYGGHLDPTLITIKNVEEISATSSAYAARLRDGNVVCWGVAGGGGTSPGINGDFVRVRSNAQAFAGIKRDGSLYAWGAATHGSPVSGPALNHSDYVEVCGAAMAFAARRASGHVVAWGDAANGGTMKPGQEIFSDIVQISGNYGAFAALRNGGGSKRVIAWGNATYGGDVREDIAALNNVKALGAATAQAFSILLDTGEVRAWGAASHGGTVPENIAIMKNVVEVSSTWHAFCARLSNGHVVAWPTNSANGGIVPEEIARLSDIIQVVGSAWSFAALRRNGTVVAWGDPKTGGDTSTVAALLLNVQAIYANSHGFTALRRDGQVVTWGVAAGGGDSSAAQPLLNGKVTYGELVPETADVAVQESVARK